MPAIESEKHPFAGTRAARALANGIKRYTANKPGGLRALAAGLNIKQATVLSAMATGRMAIPLDRAQELALELGLDVADFCLAVLEQRAPAVYQAFERAFDLTKLNRASTQARRVIEEVLSAKTVTDDQVVVISQALHSHRPHERWLAPLETGFMRVVRDQFPDGVPYNEIEPLAEAIRIHFAS